MRRSRPRLASLPALTAVAALIACGTSTGLPSAHILNAVKPDSLYALDGTPTGAPSAYDVLLAESVRTDQLAVFDFVFNLDSAGHAVFLPTGAVGLGRQSGILISPSTFDAINEAPSTGYDDSSAVQVSVGTVAVIRSRPTQCSFGAFVYEYAKLQVVAIDSAARRINFQILVDQNCGYRGLQPGIPSR